MIDGEACNFLRGWHDALWDAARDAPLHPGVEDEVRRHVYAMKEQLFGGDVVTAARTGRRALWLMEQEARLLAHTGGAAMAQRIEAAVQAVRGGA